MRICGSIESAIRLAAEQLDKEKIAKERYIKEHDDAVAREQEDEKEVGSISILNFFIFLLYSIDSNSNKYSKHL